MGYLCWVVQGAAPWHFCICHTSWTLNTYELSTGSWNMKAICLDILTIETIWKSICFIILINSSLWVDWFLQTGIVFYLFQVAGDMNLCENSNREILQRIKTEVTKNTKSLKSKLLFPVKSWINILSTVFFQRFRIFTTLFNLFRKLLLLEEN